MTTMMTTKSWLIPGRPVSGANRLLKAAECLIKDIITYRKGTEARGTPITVQGMVFGNMGEGGRYLPLCAGNDGARARR